MAGPIRQPFDIPALQKFIETSVPDIKGPVEVKQFGYGQSNPTYFLKDQAGERFVMRKKPPGRLLNPTAHRVDREYKILHALEKTPVSVPKTFAFSEDESIIGTAFYIMEFLDGRIFEDPAIPGVSPEHRKLMWQDAIRNLAEFHLVNPSSVGLANFGKPSGFYPRQLKLFKTLSEAQASAKDKKSGKPVGKIPHFDEMVEFFSQSKTQPKDRGTFIHGDYKIDNLVFHKTEPRIIGILDWEMSTIGHPMADLTNLLTPYVLSTNKRAQAMTQSGVGAANLAFIEGATPGLPSLEQCLQWYKDTARWDPIPELPWGNAFNIYKGSIIMQGIAARSALGQASSARAQEYADAMPQYGEVAWDMVTYAISSLKDKANL